LLGTTILLDNGPQFTAQEFEKYIERHQIKHVKTSTKQRKSQIFFEDVQTRTGTSPKIPTVRYNWSWLGFCWITEMLSGRVIFVRQYSYSGHHRGLHPDSHKTLVFCIRQRFREQVESGMNQSVG
jgi:hypothetical protein